MVYNQSVLTSVSNACLFVHSTVRSLCEIPGRDCHSGTLVPYELSPPPPLHGPMVLNWFPNQGCAGGRME